MACAACGASGPPPLHLAPAIAAAARVVADTNARTRQVRGTKALLARSAAQTTAVLFALVIPLAIVSAWLAHRGQGGTLEQRELLRLVQPGVAAILTVLVSGPALWVTARAARRIRAALAATPPAHSGGACACRVCGGPVGSTRGVVRCSYCGADNVVDARVLQTIGERAVIDVRDLEEDVRRQAAAIGDAGRFAVPFALMFAVLSPGLTLSVLEPWLLDLTFPLPEGLRLTLSEHGLDARAGDDAHKFCVTYQPECHRPGSRCIELGTIEPGQLVGKQPYGKSMRVVGFLDSVAGGHFAVMEDEERRRFSLPLDGLCHYGEVTAAFKTAKAAADEAERRRSAESEARMREIRKLLDGGAIPELRVVDVPVFR